MRHKLFYIIFFLTPLREYSIFYIFKKSGVVHREERRRWYSPVTVEEPSMPRMLPQAWRVPRAGLL